MPDNWDDKLPIYKQLRERVEGLIMDGAFAEGEAIPSVRSVSAESQINHLTVAKAYQELVDIGILEMRRGRGMFVLAGAREQLLAEAREHFAAQEVPALVKRAEQLSIRRVDLISMIEKEGK